MPAQLSQPEIFQAEHGLHGTRDERARCQHQRGVRSEINCDFDPVSARANTNCAALPVRSQQNHRRRQDVRQQIRKLRGISKPRFPRGWKRKIVMRAKALEPAPAPVSPVPVIKLPSQIADLLPQQARRAITTAALELDNGCGDFDHAGVEINRAASGQLKRFAGTRNHSASHQAAGITKHFFRMPSAAVNEKIKFRFQADHRSRRHSTKRAKAKTMRVAFYWAVLHLLNPGLTRLAAFARS